MRVFKRDRTMKVIATSYLTDSSKSYRPGDEIKDGELFKQAAYYAKIGKVRIVDSEKTEPVATVTTQQVPWQDADQELAFMGALGKVAVTNQPAVTQKETMQNERYLDTDNDPLVVPDQSKLSESSGRGRPKKS